MLSPAISEWQSQAHSKTKLMSLSVASLSCTALSSLILKMMTQGTNQLCPTVGHGSFSSEVVYVSIGFAVIRFLQHPHPDEVKRGQDRAFLGAS